ncbi:hypothetical protein DM01DRAFT_1406533 [Hesseltinella vesiculosa]|uniref:Uncharacterized protein n=1 Tax=Hesseltinella vesiculosa TaxID=101127 RepID=A0A1X2GKQ4_9FUNG|nr:hypothetical protein DM01DRAFT_1406533 [Hesseltinella vesiculosa]
METNTWSDKVKTLVKHLQFYWFCGHVFLVCNSIFYFMSVLSFHSVSNYYCRAYAGALIAYGIVAYNSYMAKMRTKQLLLSENIQYLILAFYWYCVPPITVTLIPFFVFSIFHILGYVQSVLLPTLFPKEANPAMNDWCAYLKAQTEKYHELAMQIAGYTEVMLISPRLILGVLTFQTSLLALIVFGQFLRSRYFDSPYTQLAFRQSVNFLDHFLLPENHNPHIPTRVSNGYGQLRTYSERIFTLPTPPAKPSTTSADKTD